MPLFLRSKKPIFGRFVDTLRVVRFFLFFDIDLVLSPSFKKNKNIGVMGRFKVD
jgi:hypothetical protein